MALRTCRLARSQTFILLGRGKKCAGSRPRSSVSCSARMDFGWSRLPSIGTPPSQASRPPALPTPISSATLAALISSRPWRSFGSPPNPSKRGPPSFSAVRSCFCMRSCISGTPPPDARVSSVSWPRFPRSSFPPSLPFGWGGRQALLRERSCEMIRWVRETSDPYLWAHR